MFQNWGFLLSEIWVLLLIAALLGLLCGWLIWGGKCKKCDGKGHQNHHDQHSHADHDHNAASGAAVAGSATASDHNTSGTAHASDDHDTGHGTANHDYDGDGVVEGKDEGVKPTTLTAARNGKADDLKQIKGVGPKMEKLCNKLGFYHFDQIAAWTPDEIAWVNANLEGFNGRVTRDNWVEQAKVLAAGGETEFSKRVEDGGVY